MQAAKQSPQPHHQPQHQLVQEVHHQQLYQEQHQHQQQDSLASLADSLPPINTSTPKAAQAGDPSPDRHGVRHEDLVNSVSGASGPFAALKAVSPTQSHVSGPDPPACEFAHIECRHAMSVCA